MARQVARRKKKSDVIDVEIDKLSTKQRRGLREAALILFGAIFVILIASLITYSIKDPAWSHSTVSDEIHNAGGKFGAWFADVAYFIFGYFAYVFPLIILLVGWKVYRGKEQTSSNNAVHVFLVSVGLILTIVSGTGLAALHFFAEGSLLPANSGGVLGSQTSLLLVGFLNPMGATLILLASLLIGIRFLGLSWLRLMDVIGKAILTGITWIKHRKQKRDMIEKAKVAHQEILAKEKIKIAIRKPPVISEPSVGIVEKGERIEKEKQIPLFIDPDVKNPLPALSLLDLPTEMKHKMSPEELESTARLLESKLKEFNIVAKVAEVFPGPIITRYEIQPAAGVKGSQVLNLAKDLARSLAVQSVRVVDVIPGKPFIGVEIPNEHREMVRLVEILQSKAYEKSSSPLTMALGKDISGLPLVADLGKMPHLLVAGTTGSGKSVAVNAMILSLLYNATPDEVRMIMIDPKMLELSIYDGIPHLLTPVVTDMKDASSALRWCVAEMEQRYKLMSALGVRNIAGYNRKIKEAIDAGEPIRDPLYNIESVEPQGTLDVLPYIVIVVDELADMMMVVGKKVEELIARLAQKARACGMHLILATQRPSVDVLTGLIKANIPTRIAFQVSSKIDSRTVLDQMGAEQLLGHGDMLYLSPGAGMPTRVHGAFVDDPEVHRVVEHLKLTGSPEYNDSILNGDQIVDIGMGAADSGPVSDDPEQDALYDEAVQIVIKSRKASISNVQRQLRIGYNRAARLIEAMEAAGLVSEAGSNGLREVLVPESSF